MISWKLGRSSLRSTTPTDYLVTPCTAESQRLSTLTPAPPTPLSHNRLRLRPPFVISIHWNNKWRAHTAIGKTYTYLKSHFRYPICYKAWQVQRSRTPTIPISSHTFYNGQLIWLSTRIYRRRKAATGSHYVPCAAAIGDSFSQKSLTTNTAVNMVAFARRMIERE